jgi:hypothetical protein
MSLLVLLRLIHKIGRAVCVCVGGGGGVTSFSLVGQVSATAPFDAVAPREIKSVVGRLAPWLAGYQQQDCQVGLQTPNSTNAIHTTVCLETPPPTLGQKCTNSDSLLPRRMHPHIKAMLRDLAHTHFTNCSSYIFRKAP